MGKDNSNESVLALKGSIKHYDWGGFNLIPSLLKLSNDTEKPFAEYWMGTHPLGPATVETANGEFSLQSLTGPLPFLLKVLDVREMLSIQVHPSKSAAEKEFARENTEGIPPDSPLRNYKDANHKPELMVALSDFWLLHGFKPTEELLDTLQNVAELRELLPVFNQSGYEGLYRHVMEMSQEEVNRILRPLIQNIPKSEEDQQVNKYDKDYWADRAAQHFNKNGNIDRGIFSIYLFNLVHLEKGEGIFQGAGVPHAYLEGQNVEIMANSDNVLRGGLTSKHIDVKELLKHVQCEPTIPRILQGESINQFERVYRTPVSDFQLSVIELDDNEKYEIQPSQPQTLLLTEGFVRIGDGRRKIDLIAGHPAAIVLPGRKIEMKASIKSVVFKAIGDVNRSE